MDIIGEIGAAAGNVWKALKTWETLEDDNKGMTVAMLKNRTNLTNDLLYEAIGWLAREDKLIFLRNGIKKTVRISVKD